MAHQFAPDVEAMLAARMQSGLYDSENDLLRRALNALGDSAAIPVPFEEADLDAIRRGRDQMLRGMGQPIDLFLEEMRAKHEVPPDA